MIRIITLALALSIPAAVLAQGTGTAGSLAPTEGGAPLSITSQEVEVRIGNGIAVTTITQVFHNATRNQLEATYSFPVPKDASLSSFSMWIHGKEVIGEVLEKKEARRIYDSITQRRRDPGLLEQNSHKLFTARVFPVPPEGDQRIQIAYYQPVEYDGGFCTYTYPLKIRTREFSNVTGTLTINVHVDSETPIIGARSPSHKDQVVMRRDDERHVLASFERRRGSLNRDFVLIYELAKERSGVKVVPFRDGREDGYFMLTLTPGERLERLKEPSHTIIILDISGSMEGAKLSTAREAAVAILDQLPEEDTVQIVSFNVGARSWPAEAAAVSEETRREAVAHLDRLRSAGGTDVLEGLRHAAGLLDPNRPNVVVLLSDGVSNSADEAMREARRLFPASQARVFALGIGNEINRGLLALLARDTGGWTDFMSIDGDVEHRARLLARKIVHRSISDVTITVEGVEVYDLHPRQLPHLFAGSQLTIFGRYSGSGEATVLVSGNVMDRRITLPVKIRFEKRATDYPEIRRSWALKAVEDALEDRDMNKDRAIERIVALGVEHSIVTPYTSMLVLESEAQYGQFGIERRNPERVRQEREAQQRRRRTPSGGTGKGGGGTRGGGGSSGGGGHGGSVGLTLLALALGAGALSLRKRNVG